MTSEKNEKYFFEIQIKKFSPFSYKWLILRTIMLLRMKKAKIVLVLGEIISHFTSKLPVRRPGKSLSRKQHKNQ